MKIVDSYASTIFIASPLIVFLCEILSEINLIVIGSSIFQFSMLDQMGKCFKESF
jgi:hypothetical protein